MEIFSLLFFFSPFFSFSSLFIMRSPWKRIEKYFLFFTRGPPGLTGFCSWKLPRFWLVLFSVHCSIWIFVRYETDFKIFTLFQLPRNTTLVQVTKRRQTPKRAQICGGKCNKCTILAS